MFQEVGYTYSTSGDLFKARSTGKGCGKEGESSDGVLHFCVYLF